MGIFLNTPRYENRMSSDENKHQIIGVSWKRGENFSISEQFHFSPLTILARLSSIFAGENSKRSAVHVRPYSTANKQCDQQQYRVAYISCGGDCGSVQPPTPPYINSPIYPYWFVWTAIQSSSNTPPLYCESIEHRLDSHAWAGGCRAPFPYDTGRIRMQQKPTPPITTIMVYWMWMIRDF